jgi:hypothetical protein
MKHKYSIFKYFPLGFKLGDTLRAIFWRIRGCDHDTDMCLDLGDDESSYMYCFRCATKLGGVINDK